ncbi:10219_t:CDS:2, partial [Ambispora gerdemannii]
NTELYNQNTHKLRKIIPNSLSQKMEHGYANRILEEKHFDILCEQEIDGQVFQRKMASKQEVLAKYNISGQRNKHFVTPARFANPSMCQGNNADSANIGTVADSNEAMCNSYIETTLHTAFHLIRMPPLNGPQIEVVGGYATGRVD